MFSKIRNKAYPDSRSVYWDNIKCVLIILVVFAHFLFGLQQSGLVNAIVDAIYYFHMPAFVFVSGYFSKSNHARSKETTIKLLSAFVLFHGAFLLAGTPTASSTKLLESFYSEWYLLALVIWRVIVPFLADFEGILPISLVFSLLIGFFPAGGNETLAINKVVTFLPFFVAGYRMSAETVERIKAKSIEKKTVIAALSLLFAILVEFFGFQCLHVNDAQLLPTSYLSVNLVEPVARLTVIIVSGLAILILLHISSDRPIPLITTAGKNSLAIYLLHRPITLAFYDLVWDCDPLVQVALALLGTVLLVAVLGSDLVAGCVDGVLERCVSVLLHQGGQNGQKDNAQNLFRTFFYAILCAIILYPVILSFVANADHLLPTSSSKTTAGEMASDSEYGPISETDPIYRVMDTETAKNFDNAYRILFAGDLILLEDQVRNAFDGSGYDFSECFEYTSKYISNADFAIGVFEGPMGGTARNYSSSNYNDGKELYLNFPDEWGKAVKAAGFDLVTTANNHALDMGEEGLARTIDIMEQLELDNTGTYRTREEREKEKVKIVEKDGMRMAILSYTMSVNNVSEDELIDGRLSYATSMIVGEDSLFFSKVKADVQADFALAKSFDPDVIIVLPHWGTQFADYPDGTQLLWEEFFKDCGADIIFGDHTHSVQPVTFDDSGYTLFCPGNYANIYREHNGDCSAMVEAYIDRDTKKVIGGAVIPMWTLSSIRGNYRPIPIYDILNDDFLGKTITTYDRERVAAAYKHITGVMLRHGLDLNMIQERCYFDREGFMRVKVPSMELEETTDKGVVYKSLTDARNVCFVGDSVTEGTKNGGVPWYEPLEDLISGRVINCGWGSATTKTLLREHLEEIVNADAELFVIAIGANDVQYRNKDSAMTAEEYIETLTQLRNAITDVHPSAGFIFVAPWTSTDGDRVSKLGYQEKVAMNDEYASALAQWTKKTGDVFVNANDDIDQVLRVYPQADYLVDYIHPNAGKGVELYAKAVMRGGSQRG